GRLLASAALVTLTGPGGAGKTRLALQVAADVLDAHPDGVWLGGLAPISDPRPVLRTLARGLGGREAAGRPLLESLTAYLHDRALLLVLDNFEHVLGAAPLVAELLAACPELKVLATSRAVLRLHGEHDFPVPPLGLPDPHATVSPAELAACKAARLLVEGARAAKPDFVVSADDAR